MPTYTLKNKITGEVEERMMKMSEYETFMKENTHYERYFSVENLPAFGDGMRMNTPGIGKADSTFEKYVINRIKQSVPGNTLGKTHKTKMPREF